MLFEDRIISLFFRTFIVYENEKHTLFFLRTSIVYVFIFLGSLWNLKIYKDTSFRYSFLYVCLVFRLRPRLSSRILENDVNSVLFVFLK